jgi:3-hydroxybutyryl-CoA dehydrogenase
VDLIPRIDGKIVKNAEGPDLTATMGNVLTRRRETYDMSDLTIGIVGAGTMGGGIAQLAVQNGHQVILRDINQDALKDSVDYIRENLETAEAEGYLDDASAAFERLTATTEIDPLADRSDLIIEAVNEELDLKRSIFEELDDATDSEVILGSNTSSISITEIAAATETPERVVGTHFFNPPIKMKLVEVITGYETSDETVAIVEDVVESFGYESVLVEDYPGFATSRLGAVLGMEAARMVQEGVASAEDIDTAMERGYNLPVGPLKLGDHNGWDVRVEVGEYLAEELGREVYRPPQNVKQMVRAGNYGVKTGEGFYDWSEEN